MLGKRKQVNFGTFQTLSLSVLIFKNSGVQKREVLLSSFALLY